MAKGFQVKFSVPELQQAMDKISAYDGRTAGKIEEAVSASTKAISKGAKQRVPVRSGKLKKSIGSRFDKKTVAGYVSAKTPYAHLVEFGAKTRTITSKSPMMIDENGIRRFAMSAKIPKRNEKPYMRPAFEDERPNLIKNITQAVKP